MRDLRRSIKLYRDLLAVPIGPVSETYARFGENLVLRRAERHDLEAFQSEPDLNRFAAVQLVTIAVEPATFDRRYAELQKLGVPLSNILERGQDRRYRLHDPDGHVVEFRSRSAKDAEPG